MYRGVPHRAGRRPALLQTMNDDSQHAPDSHLCSDHGGEHPTIWDLPHVPLGLKREWLELETRRHFLGRGAKALGMAGLATILGKTAPQLLASAAPGGMASAMPALAPNFAPKAKR